MPKIQEYQSRVGTANPVSGPRMDARQAGTGNAIQGLGQEIMTAGQRVEQRDTQDEVSTISRRLAQEQSDATLQWKETLKSGDPNDSELASKFTQATSERIDAFGDDIKTRGGREHYESLSQRLKLHLNETAISGQAELKGYKAAEDFKITVNAHSATLQGDPSSFKMVLGQTISGIDMQVQSGALSREQGEKAKYQAGVVYTKSAVQGWSELDPVGTEKRLRSGEFDTFLDGDTKRQLISQAETYTRASEVETERKRTQYERVREERNRKMESEFLVKADAGMLSTKEILSSDIDPAKKRTMVEWIAKGNTRALKTDPTKFNMVFDRIHLPDGDPNKITDPDQLNPFLGNGLDFAGLSRLRNEIDGRTSPEGRRVSDMKRTVLNVGKANLVKANPMTGFSDPLGQEQYLKFQASVEDNYQAGRSAGKSHEQLLNPDSPDYVGKNLNLFKKSPQEVIRAQAASLRATPPSGTPSPTGTPAPKKLSTAEFLAKRKADAEKAANK